MVFGVYMESTLTHHFHDFSNNDNIYNSALYTDRFHGADDDDDDAILKCNQ